jgi:hypothetical protein
MDDVAGAPVLDAAPQGSSAAVPTAAGASPQPRGVPREGLSLAALRAFAAAHAGREYTLQTDDGAVTLPFEQLTTAQVVEAVVQPATRKDALDSLAGGGLSGSDCTYAELLLAQARVPSGRTAAGPRLGLGARPAACLASLQRCVRCVRFAD